MLEAEVVQKQVVLHKVQVVLAVEEMEQLAVLVKLEQLILAEAVEAQVAIQVEAVLVVQV